MPTRTATDLREKYGAEVVDIGRKLQPASFDRQTALRDRVDQHFTKVRLEFAEGRLYCRSVLDDRTRALVLVGQWTMVKNERRLEDAIRSAIAVGVPAREVLEIILQCVCYGGDNVVDVGIEVFVRIAEELGLMEEIETSQLPLDGRDSQRSLEAERQTWHPDDVQDPRGERLMAKHGWLGISTGLRLRPKHHLNILEYLDAVDTEYADGWLEFGYQGLYSRQVVDDKTRLLCMVGDCLAVGEGTQARAHMRGSMRAGAKPQEVLEIILESSVNFGMPSMLRALRTFVTIMAEDGRLDEIGNPPAPVE